MQRPIFSVEEAQGRPEFYVRIRWADGVERQVNHFARQQDAERWIAAEAENWLRMRLGRPEFPQIQQRPPNIKYEPKLEGRAPHTLALAA